ncbi:MAG: polyprenyl synthetase family protein [Candidatus Omnitrophica bacterium]|jgi:geranylgeranyl diphosphate synthase type I|nr:polyprenyl synthetase family protein [Candidatus Omnitrophota bacterium]MDD5775786.1 polyprenyl synthetase family protein [Candidatus Omnitrophota bacterium]
MLNKIKNTVEEALKKHVSDMDGIYPFKRLSPLLGESIKEYIARPGKRVRPMLFVLGYLAFAKKPASGLYQSALSIELLHDFMLIHDDIIDKSDSRRGRPSMHKMLNNRLRLDKSVKFNGQDLAIVVGDIIYAMAIKSFLSIKENPVRKEKALNKLLDAVLYTGAGQFIEIIYGIKRIDKINKNDIYRIYDLKTAYYTFAYPLSIGATLAGAPEKQIKKIFDYGLILGRAFQIKDDILGIFGNEEETGKSSLTDLQEAKRTLLIWYAYNNSPKKDRSQISAVFSKKKVGRTDLSRMRQIIHGSGALAYAKGQISTAAKKADKIISSLGTGANIKKLLSEFYRNILSL